MRRGSEGEEELEGESGGKGREKGRGGEGRGLIQIRTKCLYV